MLKNLRYLLSFLTLSLPSIGLTSETEWSSGIESKVRLISPYTSNNNKSELFIGLEYELKEGWKTYWLSPGDGGFPQEINSESSQNVKSLEINWPTPKEFKILGIKSIGYSDNIIFPLKIKLIDNFKHTNLILKINYLVCKDICIPGNADLNLNIPPGKGKLTEHFFNIEKSISELPKSSLDLNFLDEASVNIYTDNKYIHLNFRASSNKKFIKPSVFLHTEFGLPVIEPEINLSTNSKKLNAKFTFDKKLIPAKIFESKFILNDTNQSFFIESKNTVKFKNLNKRNYIVVIFIAFLGGLILNGMPCVLPVLSIKLLSILQSSRKPSVIRRSFLITSVGIICSFILLALIFILLRYFGYSIGWGIQFQQPIFLMIIGLILVIFSLNLIGLFEISIPNFTNSKFVSKLEKSFYFKDFFNGFFATLMATPCSAPFVGTALTFAFTQSYLSMFLIFFFMGGGMASPYIAISIFPQIVQLIPKPGKWMVYLKYFLSFLIILTLIWVCNILLSHFNIYFILFSFVLLFAVTL